VSVEAQTRTNEAKITAPQQGIQTIQKKIKKPKITERKHAN